MAKLQNKNIILGICASISAYKSPNLVRLLVKDGYNVQCIMTESSKKFVSELAISNVSKNKVIGDLFDTEYSSDGAWHIKLAHNVDICLIAPCSATTLGKLASGICDNALTTLVCALPKSVPVVIYPAMDYTMWENPIVQQNVEKLRSIGYDVREPEVGELSSGLIGKGRLVEESQIVDYLSNKLTKPKDNNDLVNKEFLNTKDKIKIETELDFELLKAELSKLKGKNCLITLGPTIEKIDSVRYISNFSSGKMGLELAKEAKFRGMNVKIINGPVNIDLSDFNSISVESADEMYDRVLSEFGNQDIIIMTAAVADYKVKNQVDGKIKKEDDEPMTLTLVQNKDILKTIGHKKSKEQLVVGFALEGENAENYAQNKLQDKNADLIVLNKLSDDNQVFGNDFNTISIISKNSMEKYEKQSKRDCAKAIFNKIEELISLNK